MSFAEKQQRIITDSFGLRLRLSFYTIKRWGKGSDAWFIELTAEFCKRAGLVVGDDVELELSLADMATPPELDCLLSESPELNERWLALTDRERRESGEHIRAGKAQGTRTRRAAVIASRLRKRDKR